MRRLLLPRDSHRARHDIIPEHSLSVSHPDCYSSRLTPILSRRFSPTSELACLSQSWLVIHWK